MRDPGRAVRIRSGPLPTPAGSRDCLGQAARVQFVARPDVIQLPQAVSPTCHNVRVEPTPDRRWQIIAGGVAPDGAPVPMSFAILRGRADECAYMVPEVDHPHDGPLSLLRMSRSLFAHAWFDYEFMAVGCAVAFQGLEAALRLVYPGEDKVPARALLRRIEKAGLLPQNIVDVAEAGFQLRNQFSHPAQQSALSFPMATSMLENTHRLVALLIAMAIKGEGQAAKV